MTTQRRQIQLSNIRETIELETKLNNFLLFNNLYLDLDLRTKELWNSM